MIEWQHVSYAALNKSQAYAKSKRPEHLQDDHHVAIAESAFIAGYMECAAERESLRVINDNLRKQIGKTPTAPTLDDLV
jgi:hypothetical protein